MTRNPFYKNFSIIFFLFVTLQTISTQENDEFIGLWFSELFLAVAPDGLAVSSQQVSSAAAGAILRIDFINNSQARLYFVERTLSTFYSVRQLSPQTRLITFQLRDGGMINLSLIRVDGGWRYIYWLAVDFFTTQIEPEGDLDSKNSTGPTIDTAATVEEMPADERSQTQLYIGLLTMTINRQ